ncbi:Energy-coupling factor transporter ATP-binding protein EcfA2 [bioreactor metagenome]|uniref:Energy-coupling factor transporter ATP-binding protein EcfA2 n=1 Tax=bioreactor metagenome TaxID=1076179 RepID=A0A645C3C6_9ZZZZ
MPIKIENLFYTYAPKTPFQYEALNGISLDIADHSYVAFIGSTGSGKTTIVQHLNALLTPSKGTIIVDDYTITNRNTKNIKKLRKHVGIVFQFPEYQLFDETVERDVAFGPKNFGLKEEDAITKAHEALISVGLDQSYFQRSPFELSGGEKRRVAIAGILAIEPDILVLDEPTAGLDPRGSVEIMNLVDKMHQNGTTIILVTHDMDLVMKYAEKVFVVKDGRIISSGEPQNVFGELDENSGIEVPKVFSLAQKLKSRGVNLDICKIRNIDDLIQQIKFNKEMPK